MEKSEIIQYFEKSLYMNWSYITGFFDADGSISLLKMCRAQQKTIYLSFCNNDLSILNSIQRFIECELNIKGFIVHKKAREITHQDNFELRYTHFNKCIAILECMDIQHLVKQYKKQIAIQLYQFSRRNGKYSPQILQKRHSLENLFFATPDSSTIAGRRGSQSVS